MSNNPDNYPEKKIAGKMFFAMWLVLLALLSYMFNIIIDRQNNPNTNPVSTQLSEDIKQITLQRNRYGHYVTSGTINHHEVVFMLDTGATDVSIPEKVARKIGLQKGHAMTYSTANGNATMYSTQIDSISIENIELKNIRATINPNTDDSMILLGMSFFKASRIHPAWRHS